MDREAIGLESIEAFAASLIEDETDVGLGSAGGSTGVGSGGGGVGYETIGLAESTDPEAERPAKAGGAESERPATPEMSAVGGPIGKRLSHFRIMRELGVGTMGVVYQVEDVDLHRIVAMKVLRRQMQSTADAKRRVDRFLLEARTTARIDDPSIAHIYEIGEHHGWWFIVMEYLEGGSLKDLCDASGTVEPIRAAMMIADAARGLAAAHEAGVIHRDIKPGNLMLTRQGRCKIVDFGLVKIDSSENPFQDDDSKVIGSPFFIAPEIVKRRGAGTAADVYSLGGTLYHLLTGRPPYLAGTTEEMLRMQVEAPVPDLLELAPQCSPTMATLVSSMLSKDPADRPSAEAVALVLQGEVALATGGSASGLGLSASGSGSGSRVIMMPGDASVVASERPRRHVRRLTRAEWFSLLMLVLVSVLVFGPRVAGLWSGFRSEEGRGGSRAERRGPMSNSIGMQFVHIPEGRFRMGSPASEHGRDSDERPFDVELTRGVFMSATEVTQAQWRSVMGESYEPPEGMHPNEEDGLRFVGDALPAYVSWYEAAEFCRLISEQESGRYRLPTEAEWEYACRAGTKSAFSVGDLLGPTDANVHAEAADGDASSTGRPMPVASFSPNGWGLYDMHGNVMEWCADLLGDSPIGAVRDPWGAASGDVRVLRGGSWDGPARLARSANRWGTSPVVRMDTIGFRVVLEPGVQPTGASESFLMTRPEAARRAERTSSDSPSRRSVSASVDPGLASYAPRAELQQRVRIVGSDTMDRLLLMWERAFTRWHPGVTFRHEGLGSGTSVPALLEGLADFGPMSRTLSSVERREFLSDRGYEPLQLEVALDAMAVYVHPDNPVAESGVSVAQLSEVFAATDSDRRLTVWGELGATGWWEDVPLSAIGRNEASGTRGLFKSTVLRGGEIGDWVLELIGNAEVVDTIAGDRGGIGYGSMSYATSGVRLMPLAPAAGAAAVAPSAESVRSGGYPLARPLYLTLDAPPGRALSPLQREFIRFIFSGEGQQIVADAGLVPLSAERAAEMLEDAGAF